VCGLTLANTGNVGLTSLTVAGQSAGCPVVAVLEPGASTNCSMSRAVTQGDFDAWDANATRAVLSASVTVMPRGVVATTQVNHTATASVELLSRPDFTVTTVAATPDNVWAPGVCLVSGLSVGTAVWQMGLSATGGMHHNTLHSRLPPLQQTRR
jgi:hypothetical protein